MRQFYNPKCYVSCSDNPEISRSAKIADDLIRVAEDNGCEVIGGAVECYKGPFLSISENGDWRLACRALCNLPYFIDRESDDEAAGYEKIMIEVMGETTVLKRDARFQS